MTCLEVDTLLLYSYTSTEALQWRMAPETGTHRAKITDIYVTGKIDTHNFNIYYVACLQFRQFQYHNGAPLIALVNSYLPWKSMEMIMEVCGQVEELVNARIKYSRLHVIPRFIVLSAKTFHNFLTILIALAPHEAPPPPIHPPT